MNRRAEVRVTECEMVRQKPNYRQFAGSLLGRMLEQMNDPAIEAEYQEWRRNREAAQRKVLQEV